MTKKVKALMGGSLLTAVALLPWIPFSCANRVSKPPPSKIAQPAQPAENKFYVTLNLEDADAAQAVTEVSGLAPHRCLLRLMAPTLGKTNRVTFSLQDPEGKLVFLPHSEVSSVPDEAPWYFEQTFKPDYSQQKPGLWKWTAVVQGGPVFTCQFVMKRLKEQEKAGLRLKLNATDQALAVFASNWQVRGGRYYGVQLISEQVSVLYELRDVRWTIVPKPLSRADLENGCSYKGTLFVGCGLYRSCEYFNGQELTSWSLWKSGMSTDIFGRYSEAAFDLVPLEWIQMRNMRVADLEIECYKSWRVTGSQKSHRRPTDEFLNFYLPLLNKAPSGPASEEPIVLLDPQQIETINSLKGLR